MKSRDVQSEEAATLPSDGAEALEEWMARLASRELWIVPDAISVTRLSGDASTRRYFRVSYPAGSAVAVLYPVGFNAGESSLDRLERWCEEHPSDGLVTFANDPLCQVELTALFEGRGIPVPAVIAVADRESVIFLEDEGDVLLQHYLETASDAERTAVYAHAVDLIASIRSATTVVSREAMVAGRLAFDESKLGWELDFFLANALAYAGVAGATRLDGDAESEARDECRAIAAELAGFPRFLCHRDYHARNLMLAEADRLVVIDFQDARMGPVTYDLVSLLYDPYVPLTDGLRTEMRARFESRLVSDDLHPGRAALVREFDLMVAQRLLKAVGTYTHQAVSRGNRVYVPYIAPALADARVALERLGAFPALGKAIDVLSTAGVERR
jgi:N-acetylmuramate 1-kinase